MCIYHLFSSVVYIIESGDFRVSKVYFTLAVIYSCAPMGLFLGAFGFIDQGLIWLGCVGISMGACVNMVRFYLLAEESEEHGKK